jgi:glycine oxidase
MATSDIIVIGGGVIGLSVAFSLSRKGVRVTVIDSQEPGQASAASAGMLAPLGESTTPSPFVPLAVEALRRWPAFIDALSAETKTPLKINEPGMLRVALNEEEESELIETFEWQQSLGFALKLLCPHELSAIEPGLSKNIRRAILTPLELHVEPKLLLQALTDAVVKDGVKIIHETVTGFVTYENRITAVESAEHMHSAEIFIIAGGSWSTLLVSKLGYELPVTPIRGQIVSYGPFIPSPLTYTIYSHIGYLVPRPDGSLIAGATMEDVGFDYNNTEEGIQSLTKMATSLLPALSGVTDYTSWAGLRPICKDGMALLGDLPGWENVILATGHGRNGILLAPYTGDLIADYVTDNVPIPTMFAPARFGHVD